MYEVSMWKPDGDNDTREVLWYSLSYDTLSRYQGGILSWWTFCCSLIFVMSALIHIRTHLRNLRTWEGSSFQKKNSGTDIRWLRVYNQSDDARDIAWKKSLKTPNNYYTKEREETSSLQVIYWYVWKVWFDFYTTEHPKTKDNFSRELSDILEESARTLHFGCQRIDQENILEYIQKNKLSWQVIIVISSSLDIDDWAGIEKYSKYNDMIVIHLFHPFEVDPTDDTILESKIIKDTYSEVYKKQKEYMQSYLRMHGVSILSATCEEHPDILLNHFFKHRYAR